MIDEIRKKVIMVSEDNKIVYENMDEEKFLM